MPKLSGDQAKVWERLKHIPKPCDDTFDVDVNSMYAALLMPVFNVVHVEHKGGDIVRFKVLKNR